MSIFYLYSLSVALNIIKLEILLDLNASTPFEITAHRAESAICRRN